MQSNLIEKAKIQLGSLYISHERLLYIYTYTHMYVYVVDDKELKVLIIIIKRGANIKNRAGQPTLLLSSSNQYLGLMIGILFYTFFLY